ncbi:MAG TPA: CmcJ/NvfI family oxidoreductase [Stellaceae bacterium]|nr:CmcJ/NvfI family oxidoreductase [Stellaceae bacterium]
MQRDTAAALDLDYVEAPLNYLAPDSEKPFVYTAAPPPGMPQRSGRFEPQVVTIRDGRPVQRQLSLDKEGFALARQPTAIADFYDNAEVRRAYYPEIERFVREMLDADKVVIFDHTVRNTAPEQQAARRVREPAASVHNDYTDKSAPQRVRDLLDPAEAEARLQRRYVEINVWRPIAGPVEAWPLAVCDAASVDPRDLVASERRYPDRVGEIYVVTYNPRHRWFYFPRMERDEMLLIKCFDSATDGRARLAVHTAFEDPRTPADAPPRESIEIRMFAFF